MPAPHHSTRFAQGFEIVKAVHLDANMWTPETILTPTFKLKRNEARTLYAKQVSALRCVQSVDYR